MNMLAKDGPLTEGGTPIQAAAAQDPSPQAHAGPSLMMDLRACYEGFAGIPQETRLLFAMFAGLKLRRFGALASGIHHTSRRRRPTNAFERTVEQTKVLIAQDTRRVQWPLGIGEVVPSVIRRRLVKPYLLFSEFGRREKLDLRIDPEQFEDYLWTKLFDRTLVPADRPLLQRAEFYPTELGREYANSFSMLPRPFQRRVETQEWDLFFAPSVSPYRLAPRTSMMVRYYDVLPLLSPHTIGEPWSHAMGHGRMLQRNMQDGATFYCGSEPVRNDLLGLFPEAEARVHTIPVTVTPEYRPEIRPDAELRTILIRRRNAETAADHLDLPAVLPKLFMAVSTLEPRKNYLKFFRAFEIARRMTQEPIQLLVVANPGWRCELELAELTALVKRGAIHLSGVPTEELRVLYSMAHCVVAPSRAEGFDYSGIEGMSCGAPVIASDIPVHRWVYGDAAEYFDPYDETQLGTMMARFAELPRDEGHLAAMRDKGLRQAELYRPYTLAPRWEAAIQRQAAAALS
jgi:glycosyltransferase involved in cell wall biosynthesis